MNADPAAVAFDTVTSAVSQGADVVIIDTAGRLHNKVNLMNELSKIRRVMQKVIPEAPHEVLLVLDASTGQNAIEQARQLLPPTSMLALTKPTALPRRRGRRDLRQFEIPVNIGMRGEDRDLQMFDGLSSSIACSAIKNKIPVSKCHSRKFKKKFKKSSAFNFYFYCILKTKPIHKQNQHHHLGCSRTLSIQKC
jgi:hypothetical protein